jgi:hypothetical protein
MSGLLTALIVAAFLAGAPSASGAATAPAGEPAAEPAAAPAAAPAAPPSSSLVTVGAAPAPPAATAPPLVEPASNGASEPTARAELPAAEEEPRPKSELRFGDEGEMAFTGALSASFGHLGYSSGGSSSTSVSVEPAFDYFSAPNFSEGISAFFRYTDSTSGIDIGDRTLTFGATVALGGNFWLGDRVSFWPKFSLGIWQSRTTLSAPMGGSVSVDGTSFPIGPDTVITENAAFIQIYAPFLLHLARHFFVGFGPDGYVDILHTANTIDNRRAYLGAESTIGGWF